MKIMITGTTGFLGSRVAEFFEQKCDEYTIMKPTHQQLEVTDEGSVRKYFTENKPDVLIHCAAISDVSACEANPEKSDQINVKSCMILARECKKTGTKGIFCSSDQVYVGSKETLPHVETELLQPSNVYGRQKLEMEEACGRIDPNAVFLRLSWMYDTKKREDQHGDFISILKDTIKSGRELQFSIYDKRGITDVQEVVSNLEKVITLPGGIYNYGSYNDRSMFETVKAAFEIAMPGRFAIIPNEQAFGNGPRNLCMNTNKAEKFNITFSPTVNGVSKAVTEAHYRLLL